MNLYVRYFDKETLAMSVDEAMAFLASIPEINVDTNAAGRIAAFMAGDSVYPYRLKVSFTNYVLFLKTPANTLEEFKHMEQMRKEQKGDARVGSTAQDRKRSVMDILMDEHPGWYEGTLMFKRVVPIQDTNKFQYKDTRFRARLKARSGMDCYNRIVNHLRNRPLLRREHDLPDHRIGPEGFERDILPDPPLLKLAEQPVAFAVGTAERQQTRGEPPLVGRLLPDDLRLLLGPRNQSLVEIDVHPGHNQPDQEDRTAAPEQRNATGPHGGDFHVFAERGHGPHAAEQHRNRQDEADVPRQFVCEIGDDFRKRGVRLKKVRNVAVDVAQDEKNYEDQQQDAVLDQKFPQDIPVQLRQREPTARKPFNIFILH